MVARHEDGRLVLSSSTWISLIGMIVAGVAANLALIYGMSNSLQARIDALDDRWQERIVVITQQIQNDIRRVEGSIPPHWFKAQVDRNTERIDKLEEALRDRP